MIFDLSTISGTAYANLPDFVYAVINFAIGVSALVAVVSIVLTGFRYMLSFGDSKKIEAANRSMIFSIIGLVLVFISPTVIEFVINKILSAK